LCAASVDAEEEQGTMLLRDIRDVFNDRRSPVILASATGGPMLKSQDLVTALRRLDESPWRDMELTTRKLAAMLKDFGVTPGHNASKDIRGYRLSSFGDAFRRYLRPNRPNRPKNPDD
jgi:hypothetical protein